MSTSALDTLRRQHGEILAYEQTREQRRGPRSARELPPHLQTVKRHLAQWAQAAAAEGGEEASPLQALLLKWSPAGGDAAPQAVTRKPAKAGSKAKAAAKKPSGKKPAVDPAVLSAALPLKLVAPKPGAGAEDPAEAEAGDAGDDPTGKILGKGNWVKAHAKIIREQVPKVKQAAADSAKYLKAKREFLERNGKLLDAYIEAPTKEHSPLFAYFILFLSDLGETGGAVELAEKAIELQQTSPIKRNYHELLFDVRLAELEREAPEVAKSGTAGPSFDAFTARRDRLMADPFRGNHAKAKVCKIFAHVCMSVLAWEAARKNLQEVKFLDPNIGVETLLAQCEEKLNTK
jgi:hypothetical protein